MGSNRTDLTKCKAGKHEWVPENLCKSSRGHDQCRLCKKENDTRITRARRALAKTMTEADLISRVNLEHYYWPRVAKQEGCWLWRGSRDGEGYGYVQVLSRPINTHRIAYFIANGPIAKGLEICHRCDTPLCVNPEHLFAATHAENMRDMREKGRWPGFPPKQQVCVR
jgi:hypothetical protein